MFVTLRNHTHHVAIAGADDAPTLVLLHSLGTSSAVWQAQVAVLAASHRLVCPDFRGHGLSEVSADPLSIATLAEDVLALLAWLGVDHFALAGISLGGVVAQMVGAAAGDKLTGLALFDSYVVTANPTMWHNRAATVRDAGLASIAEGVLSLWMTPGARPTPEGRGLARMLAATPDEGYAAGCDALAQADNRARVGAIRAPTVVACGSLDRAAPLEASRALAALIPAARVEVLEGAAHIPLLHHAAQSTAIVRSIL